MSAETTFDAVIIGAGAAGLMCGGTAGQRGRKVLLLERSPNVGQKILISGGGRCNFTNLRVEPKNYLSDNPHFCRSALSRFTPLDFIKLIEKHGIAYHEKAPGQLFCNDRAHRIVDLLKAECKAGGVTIKTGCAVKRIEKKDVFSVQTDSATYTAPALVVATGGLSYPGAGATGFGYEIAAQFGLAVIACTPALVPLSYQPADVKRYGNLSGISISAAVATGRTTFTDSILFTHKGLSGPAILQLSSYWTPGEPITLDLLPHLRLNEAILKWKSERPKRRTQNPAERAPARTPGPLFPGSERDKTAPSGNSPSGTPRPSPASSITGKSSPAGPRATAKPKSRGAGSTPVNCPPRPSSPARYPGFISSEKSSTSPAGWGASISSGPGHPDTVRGCLCRLLKSGDSGRPFN